VLPSDEEISFLSSSRSSRYSQDTGLSDPWGVVVHYALRRSVLYRMGNTESLTGVQ
jgi:hypothetical protein